MTMQIGLVGSDGLVLASDQETHRNPVDSAPKGTVWDSSKTPKLKISSDGNIAASCAQDMPLAAHIAEVVLKELQNPSPESYEKRIKDIADREFRQLRHWRAAECLIALANPRSLFHFRNVNEYAGSTCMPILDHAFAGNHTNSAIFWALRFYEERPFELRSIDSLIYLASQVILDAGKLNSGSIDGLEIVVCRDSAFRRILPIEIRDLARRVERCSKRIEKSLFAKDGVIISA